MVQVLQGLETATNCAEDMDEWLSIFNVKLRHMREDIESVGISLIRYCDLQMFMLCAYESFFYFILFFFCDHFDIFSYGLHVLKGRQCFYVLIVDLIVVILGFPSVYFD